MKPSFLIIFKAKSTLFQEWIFYVPQTGIEPVLALRQTGF